MLIHHSSFQIMFTWHSPPHFNNIILFSRRFWSCICLKLKISYWSMEVKNNENQTSLIFAINGEKFELSSVEPSTTLLEFLRTQTRFKSVKLGCGEGNNILYFFCLLWIFNYLILLYVWLSIVFLSLSYFDTDSYEFFFISVSIRLFN